MSHQCLCTRWNQGIQISHSISAKSKITYTLRGWSCDSTLHTVAGADNTHQCPQNNWNCTVLKHFPSFRRQYLQLRPRSWYVRIAGFDRLPCTATRTLPRPVSTRSSTTLESSLDNVLAFGNWSWMFLSSISSILSDGIVLQKRRKISKGNHPNNQKLLCKEAPKYEHCKKRLIINMSGNLYSNRVTIFMLGVGEGIILQLEYMGMRNRRMDGPVPMMRVSRAAESPFRSLGSQHWICDVQRGTGICFPPSSSVSPCHFYSTNA